MKDNNCFFSLILKWLDHRSAEERGGGNVSARPKINKQKQYERSLNWLNSGKKPIGNILNKLKSSMYIYPSEVDVG